jgi:hypothetical protein
MRLRTPPEHVGDDLLFRGVFCPVSLPFRAGSAAGHEPVCGGYDLNLSVFSQRLHVITM